MKVADGKRRLPPSAAETLLRFFLPAGDVGLSILGDLREEYARLADGRKWSRPFWYWRQAFALLFHYSLIPALISPHRLPRATSQFEKEKVMNRLLQSFGHDCRYFFRCLRSDPLFSIIAVVTLGLGIGANCAVFSVISRVLLEPLPYPEPDRVVTLWELGPRGSQIHIAGPNFYDWHRMSNSFSSLAVYTSPQFGGQSTVLGGASPVRVGVLGVSEGFFKVFGLSPVVGRLPSPSEYRPGADPVVVVSHRFWTTQLEGREDLAAEKLEIEGFFPQVIGVMPPGFEYPAGNDIWYPTAVTPTGSRTSHNWEAVGRLAPGISLEGARSELSAIAQQLKSSYGSEIDAVDIAVTPLHEQLVGSTRRPLFLLLAGSGLLLLLACTNLAAALLARGAARQSEVSIRAALGASRLRLLQQLLTESFLLTFLGALLGLLLGAGAVRLMLSLIPSVSRVHGVSLDFRTTLFATAVTFLAALLAGTLPAFRVTRNLNQAVVPRRGSSSGRSQRWFWDGMIASEVAMALLLLVGAGLLLKSFWGILAAPAGFESEGILTARVSLSASRYPENSQIAQAYQKILEELGSLPGVSRAGLTNHLPLGGVWYNGGFEIEGRGESEGMADYRVASRDYFTAMGIPLLRGRSFEPEDDPGTADVVILNQSAAERFWPGEDPLGQRIRNLGNDRWIYPDRWLTVIGIVGDTREHSLLEPASSAIYVHYLQRPARSRAVSLILRSRNRASPDKLVPSVRQRLASIDPDLPVTFTTMESRLLDSVGERRFSMTLLALFAGIGLLLAAIGIYGVVSYAVARRTRELGIRIALGATTGQVVRLAVKNSMISVWIGLLLGTILAFLATGVLQKQLYEVSPTDPTVLTATLALLFCIALLAAWIPAHRSTRTDPLESLRAD